MDFKSGPPVANSDVLLRPGGTSEASVTIGQRQRDEVQTARDSISLRELWPPWLRKPALQLVIDGLIFRCDQVPACDLLTCVCFIDLTKGLRMSGRGNVGIV